LPHLEIVTAENGQFDKVPACRFLKLAFSAQVVNSAFPLVAVGAEFHEHIVFGNSLPVHMNNVMDAGLGRAANFALLR
jgi:hypothetical protein